MADPVGAASAVDKDIKPDAIVDNVNDKTPDPDIPDPAPKVDPPRPDKEGMEQGGDILAAMGERIGKMEGVLETLVQAATKGADDSAAPESDPVPWTHRFIRKAR